MKKGRSEHLPYLIPSATAPCFGQQLRARLAEGGLLRIPGAHNGLAALQAKAAGFQALYVSGGAISASMGLPDLGILTVDDVAFFTRMIVRAAGLPVLVDVDTGFGEILNVMHTVRVMEDAGAAAIQIEDQLLPKKCGHLNDKKLADPRDAAAKIAAAVRARRDLLVVARTDAFAKEGLDSAVARARIYIEAGADALFPEALTSLEELAAFARALPDVPLLANMTEFGVTPECTASELEAMGYRMVIWPVSSLRVAARAQQRLYGKLAIEGTTRSLLPEMLTRAELYELIDLSSYEELGGCCTIVSLGGV